MIDTKNLEFNWVGDVPIGWHKNKIKYLVTLRNQKVIGEKNDLTYIGLENIQSKTGKLLQNSTAEEQIIDGTSNRFFQGDVLFGKLRPYLAKCIVAEFDGKGTTELLVMKTRNDKLVNQYLKYIMLSNEFIDLVNSSTYGAKMPRANWDFIGNQIIPLPDMEIQYKIIDFLENQTCEIDSLIADKEKLIELLEEKRQAIITEAVTKGVNPDVKMKDSGVEWMGKIPEQWEEKKIKYLFYQVDERNSDETAELLSLFTSIGVKPRSMMEEKGNKAQTVLNYKKVKKGDIIVNKLLAWMGAVAISDYEGVTSPDYDVYRPLNSKFVHNKFYHYYFRCHYFKGDCYKYGRGIMLMRWRTYSDQFKSILVPVPPLEEQIEICVYIDEVTRDIDELINSSKALVEKLKEYRQSIIYEAVTGKIDVREYSEVRGDLWQ